MIMEGLFAGGYLFLIILLAVWVVQDIYASYKLSYALLGKLREFPRKYCLLRSIGQTVVLLAAIFKFGYDLGVSSMK